MRRVLANVVFAVPQVHRTVCRPRAAPRGPASGCTPSNPPVPLQIERTTDKRPNLAQDFKLQETYKFGFFFPRMFTQEQENYQSLKVGRVSKGKEISIELGP